MVEDALVLHVPLTPILLSYVIVLAKGGQGQSLCPSALHLSSDRALNPPVTRPYYVYIEVVAQSPRAWQVVGTKRAQASTDEVEAVMIPHKWEDD
jgi:hypothetical protein